MTLPQLNPTQQKKLDDLLEQYCDPTAAIRKVVAGPNEMKFNKDYFLSDHLPRKFEVSQEGFSCGVVTWNMMNKAHDLANCHAATKYSNNPWNTNETLAQLNYRRGLQYNFLLQQLTNPSISFVCLQEINELANFLNGFKDNPDKIKDTITKILNKSSKTDNEIQTLLAFKFLQALNKLGFTAYAPTDDLKCKSMVTLVKTTDFQVELNRSEGCLPASSPGAKNTVFKLVAKKKVGSTTNPTIDIMNAHLDYNGDPAYMLGITKLQQDSLAAHHLGIMAGDTNHPINGEIIGAIGNWNYPSNLDSISPNNPGTPNLTNMDARFITTKCYDSIFVNPSSKSKRVSATELDGCYFKNSPGSSTIEIAPKPANPANDTHTSEKGEIWMRRRTRESLQQLGLLKHYTGGRTTAMYLDLDPRNHAKIWEIIKQTGPAPKTGSPDRTSAGAPSSASRAASPAPARRGPDLATSSSALRGLSPYRTHVGASPSASAPARRGHGASPSLTPHIMTALPTSAAEQESLHDRLLSLGFTTRESSHRAPSGGVPSSLLQSPVAPSRPSIRQSSHDPRTRGSDRRSTSSRRFQSPGANIRSPRDQASSSNTPASFRTPTPPKR